MTKWISLSESLPPIGSVILMLCPKWCIFGFTDKEFIRLYEDGGDFFADLDICDFISYSELNDIYTHWLEIPKLPYTKEENGKFNSE